MNCPYCTREMENGYLRGNNSYELLWTEEPFKMSKSCIARGGWSDSSRRC